MATSAYGWIQELDPTIFWVGVVGAIGKRKNVGLVARSISMLPSDVGLVLGGSIATEAVDEVARAAKLLRASGHELVIMDRPLDDFELDALIQRVDAVAVIHSNEGPSGIFGKALAAGTRVVASGATSLKQDCRGVRGTLWARPNARALGRALEQIRLAEPPRASLATPEMFATRLIGPILEGQIAGVGGDE